MSKEIELELTRADGGITAAIGFHATGSSCGIKKGGYKDIALLFSKKPCEIATAFTSNKVKAAPVILDIERCNNKISSIVINSGNANCLTGETGDKDARTMVARVEENLKLKNDSAMVASTGVIGQNLNMERIIYGIDKLTRLIQGDNNIRDFSYGIMTTDTRPKNVAYSFKIGTKTVTIGASAKGAGMIKPDLEMTLAMPHATMLVFITTDAKIAKPQLASALKNAIKLSFNRISVDNDTSTNDSVFLMANGLAKNIEINEENENYKIFAQALLIVCQDVAKLLVKDGEGSSKLLHIIVKNALTATDAEKATRAIADSYLVKTAMFGSNPNWGRIVAALGYSGAKFDIKKLKLYINEILVFENNEVNRPNVSTATSEMISNEITITLDFGLGNKSYFFWTSDLSYDYVKINAQYIT